MGSTVRLRRPSAGGIDRALAALLAGLSGLYALGSLVGDTVPAVDTAGVLAAHLGAVVFCALPLALLGHGVLTVLGSEESGPRTVDVAAAAVALAAFVAAVWLPLEPLAFPGVALLGLAAGVGLVLVVLPR